MALMRYVHVPALAMYTLTNNVFTSTQQTIEKKSESRKKDGVDDDN